VPIVKRLLSAFALAATLSLVAATAALASTVVEYGEPSDSPFQAPSCPSNCQAIGHVTGYQVQTGSHKNPMTVKDPGKIVAFTISLAKPSDQQMSFFSNLFGGAPQAQISVLKTLPRGHQAELLAQSETVNLSNYLGSTQTFVLRKAVSVQAGRTIALTVPTWVPAFAVGLGGDQAWRSSRPAKDCNGQSQAAQTKIHSVTAYPCFFRTARLLYSVTYVPTPKPTNTTTTHHRKRH